MLNTIIDIMIYLGSALMVYNIYGFIKYSKDMRKRKGLENTGGILNLPIVLLVFFLLGYLFIAIFGNPDVIMGGVLFGGSVFVYLMYLFVNRMTKKIVENDEMAYKLREAEANDRLKTSILATMSHEMRTPMNVIIGLDDIALKNPNLPDETRLQLESIGFSARHLLGIINNVLDINRSGGENIKLKNEPFSLVEMLGQINAITQNRCSEKGLQYVCNDKDNVGEAYIGDEIRLSQALFSIIENAVKYTDTPGTVTLDVQCLKDEGDSRTLEFVISDTGIGIDEEFLPRLFEPFSQEDGSATSRYGGSGLSLAVAKSLIEQMGGSISVKSRKGEGSVFTVVIPLAVAEHEVQAEEYDNLSLVGKRVLIVEDIDMNAEIVEDLLGLEDIITERAENGQIAVNMVSASPDHYYDAILMDIRMPVMDGIESARTIRALDRPDAKKIPIIALTANAYDEDKKRCIEAGMNAHMAKPTDANLLYASLKKYIYLESH